MKTIQTKQSVTSFLSQSVTFHHSTSYPCRACDFCFISFCAISDGSLCRDFHPVAKICVGTRSLLSPHLHSCLCGPNLSTYTGRKIPVQVTSGHTKIDYQNGQLIWMYVIFSPEWTWLTCFLGGESHSIKHFPGSRRFLLNAELFQGVARYTRGPIRVEWMVRNCGSYASAYMIFPLSLETEHPGVSFSNPLGTGD